MQRQAAVNARQIAGQYSSLKHIMLGVFCTCLYLLAVAAIMFAAHLSSFPDPIGAVANHLKADPAQRDQAETL